MLITRVLGRIGVAGLLLYWVTVPAAADGLSRFQEALKQAPDDALTYKSGKPLGDNGFVLEDVVFTPPPDATQGAKAEPIPIKRVTVEDFDFDSTDKNQSPNFVKLRAEGIAISGNPADGIDLKEMAGIDKVTGDFQLDYRLDPARKTLTLNRLALDLAGLARLDLSMVLDGVNPDALDKTDAAMKDATLRTASLVFEDSTLLGKVLPAVAKMQGAEADGMIQMAKAVLDGMRPGQGPATLAVFDTLAAYLDDYKKPKGPLRVTLNPPGKVTTAELSAMANPDDDAIKSLGLVVSYPGKK